MKNSWNAPGCFTIPSTVRVGTVPAQSLAAPVAIAARQIDLPDHALADQLRGIRLRHLRDELVPGRSGEAVVAALQFQVGIADPGREQSQQGEPRRAAPEPERSRTDDLAAFQVNRQHPLIIELHDSRACLFRGGLPRPLSRSPKSSTTARNAAASSRPSTSASPAAPTPGRQLWRERRMSNAPIDQSGVWRYREFLPFLDDYARVVTLREGSTPLLDAPGAAEYGGLDRLTFKHQGFNPTGSFKDNGMTCGVAQARRLGMTRVACVSTGNTSASMAAYASAGGLQPVIFLPHGNISFGKLAQALEYGAKTLQIDANFDQILALVRQIAEKLGIYLLNSINPFRIEGQKTIMVEMMDQRDWHVPDWVVLPGGNLGQCLGFRQGAPGDARPRPDRPAAATCGRFRRKARRRSTICCTRRIARTCARSSTPRLSPPRSKSATRSPGPRRCTKSTSTGGVVEKVTEQEIATRRPSSDGAGSAASRLPPRPSPGSASCGAPGVMAADADVVAVLTGNVLKDPDYIHRYHTGILEFKDGGKIPADLANPPVLVPYDSDAICSVL